MLFCNWLTVRTIYKELCVSFLLKLNLLLHICYMYYLYLKLRVVLERKVEPQSVLKGVVFFMYIIDYRYICYMCYLYLKIKFKIKGIFEKKSATQKCDEMGSVLYI